MSDAEEFNLSPLHEAAANGDALAVRALLDAGAPVDAETRDGVTPLMCAAAWGYIDVARILIERGADINHVANRGDTALDIAEEKCEAQMASFLAEALGRKSDSPKT
jgi:ankyrin repeat protein